MELKVDTLKTLYDVSKDSTDIVLTPKGSQTTTISGNLAVANDFEVGDVVLGTFTISNYIQGDSGGNVSLNIGSGSPSNVGANTNDLYVGGDYELTGAGYIEGSSITFSALSPDVSLTRDITFDLDYGSSYANRNFYIKDRGSIVFNVKQGGRTIGSVSGNILSLAAGDSISPASFRRFVRIDGSGGAVTLTSTPNISAGSNGEMMTIVGTDDTNTVTFQDESNLGSSGLRLEGGANVTLGQRDTLHLVYLTAETAWIEVSRSNN